MKSSMKTYRDALVQLVQGDFLKSHPTQSVDLIVTSPPYNLGMKYGKHNDEMTYEDYQAFTYRWLLKAKEWSHPRTRLCLNVPLDKNRFGHESVYADVVSIAKQANWTYFTTIVWNEGTISTRTAWGSWKSPSAPYIITPVEMIAVFYLDPARAGWKIDRSSQTPDITGEEFLQWTNGLWTFNGENAKRIGHPAPFPLELPRRCIKFFTYPGARVLDPFVGSGTSLVACQQLKRYGVGFEIDGRYVKGARKRLGL